MGGSESNVRNISADWSAKDKTFSDKVEQRNYGRRDGRKRSPQSVQFIKILEGLEVGEAWQFEQKLNPVFRYYLQKRGKVFFPGKSFRTLLNKKTGRFFVLRIE